MFDEITQRERQPRAKREFRERDSDFRVRAIANMGGGNIKGGFGFSYIAFRLWPGSYVYSYLCFYKIATVDWIDSVIVQLLENIMKPWRIYELERMLGSFFFISLI